MRIVRERRLLEAKVEPFALHDVERVAQTLIVGAKSEQAAGERLVGAVALARAREGAVQLDARALRCATNEPAHEKSDPARAGRVRRRRADHYGTDDVEERDHRQ